MVLSISPTQSTPTNATSVQFAVNFTENVTGVALNDFVLAPSVSVTGTLAALTGGGASYVVTVNNVSGNGTLGLNLVDNDSIVDQLGNPLGGVGMGNGNFTGQTYTIDNTPPLVVSIVPSGSSPTNAASVQFAVTFSENVSGVALTDFAVPLTGSTTGLLAALSGGGASYVVTVSNVSGTGILGLNLDDNDSITDIAGNDLGGAGIGNGNFSGQTYTTYSTPPPAVLSINRSGSSPSIATTLQFAVTFSEAVSGVAASDFALAASGTAAGTISTVSGGGSSYTVAVTGISGLGTLGLNLVDNDSIVDQYGNPLGGPGAGNGNFTGQTYTVDATPPTVVAIVPSGSNPAKAGSVSFAVTFSETVTGVATSDFALALSGATGTISSLSGSGMSYTVTVTGVSGNGTLGLNLVDNDSIVDPFGNPLGGTGAGNGNFTGQTYTIDTTPPTVLSVNRVGASPTKATSVQFAVTFSETVSGVAASDFALAATGTAAGTISTVSGSGASYTVAVSGVSGNGALGLNLANDGAIADLAGNALSGTFTGQTYTIDTTAPTATITALTTPRTTCVNSTTVVFSEPVTGLGVGNFTLNGTALTSATATLTSSDQTTWTLANLSDLTYTSATYTLALVASSGITDLAGNALTTGASTSWTLSSTVPAVKSMTLSSGNPTKAASVLFAVTFSASVTGVAASSFSLATTGTATGTIAESGSGSAYTVTVSGVSGTGTLGLNLVDTDSIKGSSGSHTPLGGSGTTNNGGSGNFSSQAYTIDNTPPTIVSINRVGSTPTDAGSLQFAVTFSETVTGVATADFGLALSGAAGTVSAVSGSGAAYTVTVNSVSGNGTLGLNLVSDGTIADAVGNALSGTFTGQTYTIDTTPPAVVSINRIGANPTKASSVQYAVTLSENVTGVATSDFALATTGTAAGAISTVSGSGSSYTVAVSGVSGTGTLGLNLVNDGAIADAVGNCASGTFTGQAYQVVNTPPAVVSINRVGSALTDAASLQFAVTFSENVSGVNATDFTLAAAGASGTISSLSGVAANYVVTVSGVSGNGTLGLNLVDNDSIVDAVGNPLGGVAPATATSPAKSTRSRRRRRPPRSLRPKSHNGRRQFHQHSIQ